MSSKTPKVSWVATPNGLYRVSNQTVTRYTNGNGVPNDDLHDLLLDHDGQLWVATRGYGFFRLHIDERSNTAVIDEHLGKEDGLTAEWVFQAFETTDRRMWAAMAGGLAKISANTGTGRRGRWFDENNGLTYFDITALGEDPAGNLWIGTKHTGAMKLTRGGFTTFGERDGIEQVAGVFEDAGRLCFRGSAQMPRSPTVSDEPTVQPSVARHATFQTVLGCLGAQGIDWFAPAVVRYFGWVGERVTLQTRTGQWWLATGHGLTRFPAVDIFRSSRPRVRSTSSRPPMDSGRRCFGCSPIQGGTSGPLRFCRGGQAWHDGNRTRGACRSYRGPPT